jgi:integrase
VEPWSAERVAAVRDGLTERFQAMADCGSGLGMRQGELLGLAVEDIDFLRRVVHVRQQVKIVGGQRCFGPPKNGKEREVPLPDAVGLRLSAHIAQHPPVTVTLPWQAPGRKPVTANLVFTSATGRAIERNHWNRYQWKPAVRAADVPVARDNGFHALRHHYASSLQHNGVDVKALAEALGHHDPGFTLRVYGHLMPAAADRIRQAVDGTYRSHGTTTARKAGNA